MTRPDMGNCARCGNPADKSSSGMAECWPCWHWRKLDLPAAQHWHKAAEHFLSNVDMYDLMTYLPACGLSQDEMTVMLKAARKVVDHSKKVIDGYTAREAAAAAQAPALCDTPNGEVAK